MLEKLSVSGLNLSVKVIMNRVPLYFREENCSSCTESLSKNIFNVSFLKWILLTLYKIRYKSISILDFGF